MIKYFCLIILIFNFSCVQNKNEKSIEGLNTTEVKIDKIVNSSFSQKNIVADLHIIIPENYKELIESPANGRKMERVIMDLDNDKKADTSFIVKNENDFPNYLLLIFLTSHNKTYKFKLIDNTDFNDGFQEYPVQLKVKKNVLEVGYFREGTAVFGRFLKFKFDEKKKKLKLIGYDSGYRIGPAEHFSKSYNLTNGDYVVKLEKALPNEHTEIFKGKGKVENIYIDNITEKTLDKLDKIGSEFESE